MRRIYINGSIYTLNQTEPLVEAVVTENGRFIDMGPTDKMITFWKNSETEVIDLEGKTVTPGLTDSHLHLSMLAESFVTLDLAGVTSKQTMLEKVKQQAESLNAGEWLVGGNWDENLFTDGSIPTIEELNRVAPQNPLILHRICRHAAVVNQKTLDVIQYHSGMTIPEGGTIVLDEFNNEPTGLILESAKDLVTEHIPERSFDGWLHALRKAIQFSLSQGLTSVHSNDPLYLGGLEQTYQLYDQLINKEGLGLRTNLLINHEFLPDLRKNGMYPGYGNEHLQIGAIKLFADGAFGQSTALLSEPYTDQPNHFGDAMFDEEGLRSIIKEARSLDFPVAIHAIGDSALTTVLDVLDEFPTVAYRDRLIHTLLVNDDLIERLAHPSRVVDIQPRFLASDFPWVQERLGKERINRAYVWKTLMERGVRCAGGSDAPVEPVDPLLGIHAAVSRKTPGDTHNGYHPAEKLSMKEAFQLFTESSAYATNEETVKGTIARGKFADMTVFSSNPFAMEDADELLSTNVSMTIIGGEVKYRQ